MTVSLDDIDIPNLANRLNAIAARESPVYENMTVNAALAAGSANVTGALAAGSADITGPLTLTGLLTASAATVAASVTDTAIGGTPLVDTINAVTSTGASEAVTLPAATKGAIVIVILETASNAVDVFPAGTDAINALGAGVALTMAARAAALFACVANGLWLTVPNLPS